MKIRLEGTKVEIAEYVARLELVFNVRDISKYYPNRPPSKLGRVYVEINLDGAPPLAVRAEAVRTDRVPIQKKTVRQIGS